MSDETKIDERREVVAEAIARWHELGAVFGQDYIVDTDEHNVCMQLADVVLAALDGANRPAHAFRRDLL